MKYTKIYDWLIIVLRLTKYGDVTNAGELLQIYAYARQSSREGSLLSATGAADLFVIVFWFAHGGIHGESGSLWFSVSKTWFNNMCKNSE